MHSSMTIWFTGSSSTLRICVVPYSSLLVGLRSVKHAASFMLAGVPDQKDKGYHLCSKKIKSSLWM